MPRNSDVFNITGAAAFLGAHEQTVRRLARRGAIPAFKVGKDWRFRKEALLRWLEEQQRARGGRCSVLVVLGGRVKTGQSWTGQNRPVA